MRWKGVGVSRSGVRWVVVLFVVVASFYGGRGACRCAVVGFVFMRRGLQCSAVHASLARCLDPIWPSFVLVFCPTR